MISVPLHVMLAVLLDALIGDPRGWPHPVRWVARVAVFLESRTRTSFRNERVAGLVTALVVIASVCAATLILLGLAGHVHPLAHDAISIVIIYAGIARHDLAKHARDVHQALLATDLASSRRRVGMICGRDTEPLDAHGVVKAAVESVAENTVDGVTAPIFYAFLGGPVGIMAYKAVSTLDSLFGYQNAHYRRFGWASARLDDLAAYVPSRLTAVIIPAAAWICGLRARQSLQIMKRDRLKHASPNSGHAEAAFAGALGVRLGGPASYDGILRKKPFLGDPIVAPTPFTILESISLMNTTSVLFLVVLTILFFGIDRVLMFR